MFDIASFGKKLKVYVYNEASTREVILVKLKEFVVWYFSEYDNGTFGYDCLNNYSGNCLNKSPCNKQTGHCDKGCKPRYTKVFFSESKYCKINSMLRKRKIIIQTVVSFI